MSHEIRTPLNGVIGMTSLLAETPLEDKQSHLLSVIRSSGEALLGIINDILDMSAIQAGKAGRLEEAAFELRDTVDAVIKILAQKAQDKDIQLICKFNPLVNTQDVVGDSVRIRQIVMNLVGNAVKFCNSGGLVLVKVDVRAKDDGTKTKQVFSNGQFSQRLFKNNESAILQEEINQESMFVKGIEPTVLARHTQEDDEANQGADEMRKQVLVIQVMDTGKGMDVDSQSRLFRPYDQLDASIRRKFGGTGLGLVISKHLIEQMGGQITVSSTVDVGTTFSFTLVLKVSVGRLTLSSALSNKFFLVVCCSPLERSAIADQLTVTGVKFYSMRWGRDALEHLISLPQSENPSAVIFCNPILHQIKKSDCADPFQTTTIGPVGMEVENRPPTEEELTIIDIELKAFNELLSRSIYMILSVPYPQLQRADALFSGKRCGQVVPKPIPQADLKAALLRSFSSQTEPSMETKELEDVRSHLRILICEDNPINSRVVVGMLKKDHCIPPIVATNGAIGVELWKSRPFDVILMDCQMPVMDGFEATRIIRRIEAKEKAEKSIPIIALTAQALADDRDHCLESGMSHYLQKPVQIDKLRALMSSFIKSKR